MSFSIKFVSILAALFVVAACTAPSSSVDYADIASIDSNKTFLVTNSPDGKYNSTIYHGTGAEVGSIVAGSVMRYADNVEMSNKVLTIEQAQAYAASINADYILIPKLTHYEDRNTPWSGIPDRASVQIIVYDNMNNRKIDSTMISANSTSFTLANDQPMFLLREPINGYISSLF